ncbi:MAG: beta-N-acetylhexosaminidase [Ferruginibacter sp.]
MQRAFSFILILLMNSAVLVAQQINDITPKPVSVKLLEHNGTAIKNGASISTSVLFKQQASYLQQQIKDQCGLNLIIKEDSNATIQLQLDETLVLPEMYQLHIENEHIILKAKSIRGIINGMQTLLQLLPLQKTSLAHLPACNIKDYPRFAYRGMHLDVVRHFFPVSYIKKYIDYLTFHKFNTFHWHLTDDQGWRIEILSYPKLNSIGSWRDSTLVGHFFKDTPAVYEHQRYGGFYTRAEVKEVIAYATIRGITIIPEIDVPGHSRATITSYPELSTNPAATWGVAYTWGMFNRQNNVLAPSAATFEFLRKVFHEIADLFPSPYIHLGGDECSKIWWKQNEATQAFMKKNGIKDEMALQTYFIEQVSKYLKEKNKKVIGWHEIMEGKLDTSTIVMNWSNDAKALEAVLKGYSVIMTPSVPYYLNQYQSKDPTDSLAIGGYNSLEAVYRYDPLPISVEKIGLSNKILGGQGNIWTEYIANSSKVDYMLFPRMTAISESLWTSSKQKDYKDFLRRLKVQIIPRYKYWNSSWFKDFEIWTTNK